MSPTYPLIKYLGDVGLSIIAAKRNQFFNKKVR